MRAAVLALALAIAGPATLRAQSLCDPAADTLRPTLDYLRVLVTAAPGTEADSSRVMYHLARMRASEVKIVTDAAVCARASAAYAQQAGDTLRRPVLVIQAGNRYHVLSVVSPVRAGEWEVQFVFDKSFTLVASIIS